MKTTIYYIGNPSDKKDSPPLVYVNKLKKLLPYLSFVHFDPTEQINVPGNKELIILDTVMGIKKVTLFLDLASFQLSPRVSPHDYDLPLELGLLIKLKKIKGAKIIGLPVAGNSKDILKDLTKILNSI